MSTDTKMTGQRNSLATIVQPYNAGLWYDGSHNQPAMGDIMVYGLALTWGAQHASDPDGVFWQILKLTEAEGGGQVFLDEDPDRYQYLSDMAESALEWLNDWVAPESMSFGWHEGDLFLHRDVWWDLIH